MAGDNIFQQYMQPAKSVLDYTNDMDVADLRKQQLIGAQRNNALAGLVYQGQVQDNQAKQSDNALIRSAYGKAAGNQDALLGLLRGADATQGTVAHAADVEKSMLERLKTSATANKDNSAAIQDQQATVDKVMTRYKGALEGIQNPQQAAQWLAAQYNDPTIGAHIARLGPQADALSRIPTEPAEFQKWKMSTGMGMEKYAAHVKADPVETKLGNRVAFFDKNPNSPTYGKEVAGAAIGQSLDNAASTAAQVQVAGMNNATSRANNKDSLAQGERLAQGAVTYHTDGSGNLVALPSKAAPGAMIRAQPVVSGPGMLPMQGKDAGLNDSQSKSLLFGSRAKAADKVLAEMAAGGVERSGNINAAASSLPFVGGAMDTLTNFTQSAGQQQVQQAKRDFMTAVLRRESGASISPSEFETADKIYFPQPSDDEPTKKRKANSRQLAINGMLAEVPEGKRNSLLQPGTPSAKPGGTINFADLPN